MSAMRVIPSAVREPPTELAIGSAQAAVTLQKLRIAPTQGPAGARISACVLQFAGFSSKTYRNRWPWKGERA
jgi:hypothetical protein